MSLNGYLKKKELVRLQAVNKLTKYYITPKVYRNSMLKLKVNIDAIIEMIINYVPISSERKLFNDHFENYSPINRLAYLAYYYAKRWYNLENGQFNYLTDYIEYSNIKIKFDIQQITNFKTIHLLKKNNIRYIDFLQKD